MHETATQHRTITEDGHRKTLKGCINLLIRIFPILFEDKDMLLRCMWREQALFGNQINAIKMMESISILLFKPGFSIQDVPGTSEFNLFGIDENLIWKAGITVMDAPNTHNQGYNQVRIQLLRLLIIILSQPLYYGPDEYLLVLNPFSTYFTSRRAKNTKNLFVSLVNTIIAYDCQGYGIPYLSAIDDRGDQETLTTLCLDLLLILIEYKPPSNENLTYLIRGGHISLNRVKDYFMNLCQDPNDLGVLEDLTINEHFRLMRVIHGRVNLDPLYTGFSKFFQNIIDS